MTLTIRSTSIILLGLLAASPVSAADPKLAKIQHIVVIYEENRSFDNLYGNFPGADGLAHAGAAAVQVDKNGKPFAKLPPILDTSRHPPVVDTRFPADLPNRPFDADPYVPLDKLTGDLAHRFYLEQGQIDGGKMDKFAALSDAGGLTMGYFDGSRLPLYKIAQDYTLADHFFHAAFGGSFLNHMWLVCACTPTYPNAPANMVSQFDAAGNLVAEKIVTPDGYAVDTIQSSAMPHDPKITDKSRLLPLQTMATIGDRLSEKNISWAYYAGGFDDAVAGHPDKLFQFHHQPFAYFAQFAEGTRARAEHLKDAKDFERAIASGTLPAVAFYKPIGALTQHPGYGEIMAGDQHAADIIHEIQASPQWSGTVIIVTYDEHGGTWDHVAPPKGDRWGPGTRVPAIVVSPFAKKHFVDHTVYDTTSILKLIEERFDLKPLGDRDARANDLSNALE